ncbi:MAG: hypothetical protein KF729_37035 [Sandaracinaceae bacterium]|nr:hypothetical protein [Sandaracinaceae bacterium]
MRLLALLNGRAGLKPDHTTTAIVREAARRHGHGYVAAVNDVSLTEDGDVAFGARRLDASLPNTREALRGLRTRARETVLSGDLDALIVRTNPGRDRARALLHETALNLCRIAQLRGVVVLNDPSALPIASDKFFLTHLPESLRPRMIVSRDAARLNAFVEEAKGPTVLKPIFGTQGRAVFRVTGGSANLAALIEVLVGDGYVIAQDYLRRALEGDRRVIALEGKLLEVDGRPCTVRRVPHEGEFRSNVHLGGTPKKGEPTAAILRAASSIAEILAEHGIWMAGVDMVGTKAVEINLRSPGGILEAAAFEEVDFIGAIVDSIERQVAAAGAGARRAPRP